MTWRASSGIRAWVIQRVSGAYLAVCFVVLGAGIASVPAVTHEVVRAWFAHPAGNIAAALFFVALAFHAWVGMRDVILDYVSRAVWRFTLLIVTLLTLAASLLWSLRVLWNLPVT